MLNKEYAQKLALVQEELEGLLNDGEIIAPKLVEAMNYSLLSGGKRIRPILLMAAADAVGGDGRQFVRTACALEMIHAYSLIHDDLPAMDDDDYRRGKLTNHKVYGEAMAILAGDALLTKAFAVICSQQQVEADKLLRVVAEISAAAGPGGMVGGQVIDMTSENKTVPQSELELMHKAKTGALFKAAIRCGAILAAADEAELAALTVYADNFGLAFQITDDILDVTGTIEEIGKPVGSDERNNKSTYVTLTSLEEAKELAQAAVDRAVAALVLFGGKADFLRGLVQALLTRKN